MNDLDRVESSVHLKAGCPKCDQRRKYFFIDVSIEPYHGDMPMWDIAHLGIVVTNEDGIEELRYVLNINFNDPANDIVSQQMLVNFNEFIRTYFTEGSVIIGYEVDATLTLLKDLLARYEVRGFNDFFRAKRIDLKYVALFLDEAGNIGLKDYSFPSLVEFLGGPSMEETYGIGKAMLIATSFFTLRDKYV